MTSTLNIDTDAVRKLAKLLDETGLTEIEYAEGEARIRLTRHQPQAAYVAAPAAMAVAQPAQFQSATQATPAPAAEDAGGETIKSPMVGTAYLSPEPGAKPFISTGATVKTGDTLLIIEAMKVMNPIKAPRDGVIKKIVVADTKPVEFGETLLVLG
ncbi:MAG: acetyl-CoA carboxylase biotin carboxyl carrier protein [Alphaproteobacteria bacterium]|nr:acetyl-CoA carboxylase biotin carboxyl carrier protein [Alphaproteobacteria bacterium]NDC56795.1 acetyl-CoA carboxylase biotin carboxyl carrier protein [Alphaproteobacteria bacterium]NDG04640.1 acetyl-CoA carboxylase biotin carboxyl carrier protein [Alphaproteobacteria bacterium]